MGSPQKDNSSNQHPSPHIPWPEMYQSAASYNQASFHIPAYRKSKSLGQAHSAALFSSLGFPTGQKGLREHTRKLQRKFASFKEPLTTPAAATLKSSPTRRPCDAVYESTEMKHCTHASPSKTAISSPTMRPSMSSSTRWPCNAVDQSTEMKHCAHASPSKVAMSFPTTCPSNALSDSVQLRHCAGDKMPWTLNGRSFHLAICVAIAHAILGALFLLFYGMWMLLDDYRRPIQWAVLFSMPLRQVHKATVRFWTRPLRQGMLQTAWAIPGALCKAFLGTFIHVRIGFHYLQDPIAYKKHREIDFSTCMQWLTSFALISIGHELLGAAALVTATFVSMLVYAGGTSLGIIIPLFSHLDIKAAWSILSSKHRKVGHRLWTRDPVVRFFKLVNRRLTCGLLENLHCIVAVFLISVMIGGCVVGPIFFSYKVGVEGKDAVVALKAHIQRSNYAERVGLKQWLEENEVPNLMETYAGSVYSTVSDQIDAFAAQHNVTDIVKAAKKYMARLVSQHGENMSSVAGPYHLSLERLQALREKIGRYDLKGVYSELEQAVLAILEHCHTSKEDLMERARQLGRKWLDIAEGLIASSSTLLYMLFSLGYSIASGAAGVMNLVAQIVVFVSVLYYLISSESGGVVQQVLSMLPVSETARSRFATVVEETISNVLLSTAKAAFFQATFTWLLFRFFHIRFLYTLTVLALFSALLSLPSWCQISSLLAGLQLAAAGQYVQSALLVVVYSCIIRCGVLAIHKGRPGQFTGLSIAVGVLLFWPSPERAIMGPLFITFLMALKNLYKEFVLDSEKGGSAIRGGHPSAHNTSSAPPCSSDLEMLA